MRFKKNIFRLYGDKLINYWIDYLRFVYKWEVLKVDFENILSALDYDNSNFLVDFKNSDLTWYKIRASTWDWLIGVVVFNWLSLPVFNFISYDDDKKHLFRCSWKLDVYGSFFRMAEMLHMGYKDLLFRYFWDLSSLSISRIDYRYDFKDISVLDLSNLIVVRKNSKVDKIYRWDLQSFGMGSKSAKRFYCRVYNKTDDIKFKNKSLLYSDYLKYDVVTRFEVEFLNHFCRGYTFQNIDKLIDKIYNYLWFVDNWKRYVYYDEIATIEEDKLYSVRNFVGRWKKLVEYGYNPFELLYNYLISQYWQDKVIDLLYDLYGKL